MVNVIVSYKWVNINNRYVNEKSLIMLVIKLLLNWGYILYIK